MAEQIRIEHPVFLHDGDVAIGAVREGGANKLTVYIENAGDFSIPLSAVRDVHSSKVVLDGAKLDDRVRTAIGRAHASEDNEDHAPIDD